jgi:hypothetical protein
VAASGDADPSIHALIARELHDLTPAPMLARPLLRVWA